VVVEEQKIEVDGLPICYLTAGTGPPLVLLHGAGDNALDWRWVMPALAATNQVYAPDLPGSPDSTRPTADYSPAFFERFVTAFADALGVERATFVGNSLGELLIALRLALSEPARVITLSSIGPTSPKKTFGSASMRGVKRVSSDDTGS
jgi:pimeloyl-ACP methyl ester carboxylesterase